MSKHGLSDLPELDTSNTAPHLAIHQLVKVEVRYRCICGEVVRTSEALPQVSLMDVTTFSDRVRQITARSRERWEAHLRG